MDTEENKDQTVGESFKELCNTSSFSETVNCLNVESFSTEEIITIISDDQNNLRFVVVEFNCSFDVKSDDLMDFSMTEELYDFWSSKIRQMNFSFSNEDQLIRFNLSLVPTLEYFVSLHDPQFFINSYLVQSIPKAFVHLESGRNFIGMELEYRYDWRTFMILFQPLMLFSMRG